jgi:hypothetical protein
MSGVEILKRARAHFRASRTTESLRKVHVPEWDCDVYFWPKMSVEESREVGRHIRVENGRAEITAGDIDSASVSQVLLRARDHNGMRLFGDEDEAALRDTDPAVLKRIASEFGWSSDSLGDAEGN